VAAAPSCGEVLFLSQSPVAGPDNTSGLVFGK